MDSIFILSFLKYSLALWKLCNKFIHGETIEEQHHKEHDELKFSMSSTYEEFNGDTFIISKSNDSLFPKPLTEMIKMELDWKKCWLTMHTEAKTLGMNTMRHPEQPESYNLVFSMEGTYKS